MSTKNKEISRKVLIVSAILALCLQVIEGFVGLKETRCSLDPDDFNNPCPSLYDADCDGAHCKCPSGTHEDKNLKRCVKGGGGGGGGGGFDDLPFDYVPGKKPEKKPTPAPPPPRQPQPKPPPPPVVPNQPQAPVEGGYNIPHRPGYNPNQPGYPGQPNYYPNQPNQPGQPGGYPNQPGQPGGYPNQPGQPGGYPIQPGQPGGYPNQPGQPGGYPNQPGAYPNQPGYNPNAPGYNPNNPAYNPSYPGYNPNQPGAYNPNQPGNRNPNQPGKGGYGKSTYSGDPHIAEKTGGGIGGGLGFLILIGLVYFCCCRGEKGKNLRSKLPFFKGGGQNANSYQMPQQQPNQYPNAPNQYPNAPPPGPEQYPQ